jgi:hypothetical protein
MQSAMNNHASGKTDFLLPPHTDSLDRTLDHKAPIGSPENPIVQFERAPEVKMPHELEA